MFNQFHFKLRFQMNPQAAKISDWFQSGLQNIYSKFAPSAHLLLPEMMNIMFAV